ncbi:MAG TPA: FHA domain-containing protein [Gemmataceae bacterium]|nr:FHA domain-containing protein [Gemmataceae bacterium]
MNYEAHGELQPIGGGDPIPLIREELTLGRRESCDIRLNYPNISGVHAQLTFRNGYWYIRDMNSTNGIKVQGVRVQEKLLHPRDEITIGKRKYIIEYELPADRRALDEVVEEDIMGQSLLEKAGLERPKAPPPSRGSRKSSESFDAGDFLLADE